MLNKTKHKTAIAVAAGIAVSVTLFACRSDSESPGQTSSVDSAPTTRPVYANIFGPVPEKGGAQLWAENCNRCHNAPPPDRFSDAQWDVVIQHMRMRANLTGHEARQIAEFLKASN
jgi:hypothetical protein